MASDAEHTAALAAQAAEHAATVQQLRAEHAAALAAHVPPPITMLEIYARHAKNEACSAAAEAGDAEALQRELAGMPRHEVAALRGVRVRVCVWVAGGLHGVRGVRVRGVWCARVDVASGTVAGGQWRLTDI